MSKRKEKLTVYYDGTCPMCTAFTEYSEKNLGIEKVEFLDVYSNKTPDGLSKKELLSEMKMIDSNNVVLSGSDAIFAVLKRHRYLFWLGNIGNLPIIRQCARPAYRLISAQRHFIFGANSRIFWIRIITLIGLLMGLFLSLPLWIGDRILPLVPVIAIPVTGTIPALLFFVLISTLVWAIASTKPKLPPLLECGDTSFTSNT